METGDVRDGTMLGRMEVARAEPVSEELGRLVDAREEVEAQLSGSLER